MFSKELENLIQATLEDGQLEDYEKAALQKHAMAEGADLTELEIYINSILQRRKRELAQAEEAKQAEIDQKKKEAFGRVCPNCGRQVPPLTLKCDCGYEFTSSKRVSSVQILSEKRRLCKSDIPNNEEEIIELLAFALPNSRLKGGFLGTMENRYIAVVVITFSFSIVIGIVAYMSIGDLLAAFCVVFFGLWVLVVIGCGMANHIDVETIRWNEKAMDLHANIEQILQKGRSLRGDEEFSKQLDYFESQFEGTKYFIHNRSLRKLADFVTHNRLTRKLVDLCERLAYELF